MRRILVGAAVLSLGLALGCRTAPIERQRMPSGPGSVEGRVVGEGVAGGAWVVVYLEDGGGSEPAADTPSLRRDSEGLVSELLVVGVGQRLEIVNADRIHHRFFSSSPDNAFELPTLAAGGRQDLTFEHSGLVRVYCSLHPEESATIFVAPSQHFAKVRAPGRWAIENVPPGRYGLGAWSEGAVAARDEITVRSGSSAFAEIALEEALP